ncbi:MAG: ShlB/FhaC/HecB family hemolysin secretion/activation protein [Methylocystis sp.]
MQNKIAIFGSVSFAALALATQAQAQSIGLPYNAGDALRQSELARREAPTAPKPQISLPQFALPRLSIPGNEKLLVRRFEVDAPSGLIPLDETGEVLAPFENRKLTLTEIYDAADQITNLYRSHGYIVAKAYVPEQDARSGTLRIKLLIGQRAAVTLENNSLVDSTLLQGVIDHALEPSPYLRKDEIERAMLLVSDLPGAGVPRIAVSPGKQPETSDLNFVAPEMPRYEGYVLGDNYGYAYTGRLRMSGAVSVNSPLGWGDRLSLFGLLTENTELANWRAAYSFPIGFDGLKAEISAFQTDYVLGGLYKPSDAAGLANGAAANFTYALKRQRDDSIFLFSNFTHKYLDDKVLNTSTASRTIDSGTVGVTRSTVGSLFDFPLVTETTLSATTGYVNFPDPTEKAANIAGVNTAGSYARLNLNFNSTLAFNPWLSLTTALRAQKSLGRNLDASEKIEVTGFYGVKSYDEGVAGDSGYVFTPELKFALPEIENYKHSIGIFTDVGAAWLQNGSYTTTQFGYSPVSDAGAGYYATYQFGPARSIFLKAQVAHTYGSESVAPAYDKHTKGLVQIGMSTATEPTHGGLFSEAPSPDFGEKLSAWMPDGPAESDSSSSKPPQPASPLGVFGADMPGRGAMIFSANPYFSNFSHSQIGRQYVSPQQIAANTGWYYNPWLNLRVVPIDMAVAQQSLTLAYGLTDTLAIHIGTGFIEKHSHMETFNGGATYSPPFSNLLPLGMSFPADDSLTDTTLSGIWRFYEDPINKLQLHVGMSFPTGSANEPGTLLQPNGTYQTARDFYGMETGTGTFDLMPGIAYKGVLNDWSWGLSYRARLPLAPNREGYAWGDLHEFNAWGGYSWIPGLTTTLRLVGTLQGSIIGHDPQVVGKVQTANPNSYGGQRVGIFGGATILGSLIGTPAFEFGVEAGVPVYQDLNGPQMGRNWQAQMAVRYKVGKEDRSSLPFGLGNYLPPPSADPQTPLWSGFFAGMNGGANFGGNDTLNTIPGATAAVALPGTFRYISYIATAANSSLTLSNNGFLGGAQIGYNWQIGRSAVFGFEADVDGVVGSKGSTNEVVSAATWPFAATGATNGYKALDYVGTLRARLGYLATPRLLLYGTGGLAMANAHLNTSVYVQASVGSISYPVYGGALYEDLRVGWTAGVGAEWMFAPHWSAKLEYLAYDTGTAHPIGGVLLQQTIPGLKSFTVPQPSYRFDGNMARLGLSYHFNGRQPAESRVLKSAAADTLDPAPIKTLHTADSWTSFYGGLNFGGARTSGSGETGWLPYADPSGAIGSIPANWPLPQLLTLNPPVTVTPNSAMSNLFFFPSGAQLGSVAGLIGGAQIGYNYRFANDFVIGAEADLQGSSVTSGQRGAANSLYPSPYGVVQYLDNFSDQYLSSGVVTPLASSSGGVALPWLGTARARAGYLPLSSLLVYGTAGLSYAQVTTYNSSEIRAGWSGGGGLEWMFMAGWSAKAEYLHVDLGKGGAADPWFWASGYRSHPQASIARAGLNYHFNFGSSEPVAGE